MTFPPVSRLGRHFANVGDVIIYPDVLWGFSHCKQRKPGRCLFFHTFIKNLAYLTPHRIWSCSVSRTFRFSTWSLFFRKKKYIIFIAFSFCEGVVEPVWFLSPPKKRTVKKKKGFVVNRKFYFILDQWPIAYRYHEDRFLKVKNLVTKKSLSRMFW